MMEIKHFFAVPSVDKFPGIVDSEIPGVIIFGDGDIILNPGRKAVILKVINRGDRPIQVFFPLNCYLEHIFSRNPPYTLRKLRFLLYCLYSLALFQVGSHYHFIETNPCLYFDRIKAYGMRLNIPAGTATRFEVQH